MPWLMTFSIGPVQSFISAARRTRDLWCGSKLLADLSQTAAQRLRDDGAVLIFPGTKSPASPIPEGIANEITCVVSEPRTPQELSLAAKRAVIAKWKTFADHTKKVMVADREVIDWRRFDEQVSDVIETYAAWVKFDDPERYQDDRNRLSSLLAGRKRTRSYLQSVQQEMQVPKSSLDGLRETVFRQQPAREGHAQSPVRMRRYLRMNEGEQLDAVGLIKRTVFPEFFPSISRLAAGPWLRGLPRRADGFLAELRGLCARIPPVGLSRADWPQFEEFPFDGSIVYLERHKEIQAQFGLEQEHLDVLGEIERLLRTSGLDEPQPYVAILTGDADGMGQVLSEIGKQEAHSQFSFGMASFTSEVKRIVAIHKGASIYAGGDDVLALTPLDQAVACADALRRRYVEVVEHTMSALPEDQRPASKSTLSIGIGIGHFLDPLEDLLDLARAAEHRAKKGDKNSLCIMLQPRSGSRIEICRSWKDDPNQRMANAVSWHMGNLLPDGVGYALQKLAEFYEGWPDGQSRTEAMRADAKRVLARKRSTAAKDQLTAFDHMDGFVDAMGAPDDLRQLATELIIARRIAKATEQANPKVARPPNHEAPESAN